jgi:hypothetical protein
MIRVVLCFLIALTGWCRNPDKITFDSLVSEPVITVTTPTPVVNRTIRRYPDKEQGALAAAIRERYFQKKSGGHYIDEPLTQLRYREAGATSGVWIPTGRNRVLGVHPSMDFTIGGWRGRWYTDFEMGLRFNRSAHDYQVLYNDTLRTTHHYLGYSVAMAIGYGVANFKDTSVYILAGLGFDSFDSVQVPQTPNNDDNAAGLNSFKMITGIGMQHFPKKGGYWGVELLYNTLYYQNPGGTAVDGNAVTLRLVFGRIFETSRYRRVYVP